MTSTVIKQARGHQAVRPIRSAARVAAPLMALPDPAIARIEAALAAAQAELDESRVEIDRLRAVNAEQIPAARQEGYEAGLEAAGRREDDAIAALQRGIDGAIASVDEQLAGVERLSALVARECLDHIFGDDDKRSHLLHEIIAHQLRRIEAESVVSIEVSAEDFLDAAALDDLVPASGPKVLLKQRSGLDRGKVIINLTLGTLSVGLDQQWGRLRETLDELGTSGA